MTVRRHGNTETQKLMMKWTSFAYIIYNEFSVNIIENCLTSWASQNKHIIILNVWCILYALKFLIWVRLIVWTENRNKNHFSWSSFEIHWLPSPSSNSNRVNISPLIVVNYYQSSKSQWYYQSSNTYDWYKISGDLVWLFTRDFYPNHFLLSTREITYGPHDMGHMIWVLL